MKKFVFTLLIFFTMTNRSSALSVIINDRILVTDVPSQIVNDRTMVPVGAIAHTLESEVEWDDVTKTVHITKNATIIGIQIGNNKAVVNNRNVEIDVPAQIINGRVMVPLSFVALNMGLDVEWDAVTQTAFIKSSDDHFEAMINIPSSDWYYVKEIVDAKTLKIIFDGKVKTVKMIGINTVDNQDTSMNNEGLAKAAKNLTMEYLEGRHISLESDISNTDRDGNLLAYVFIDGEMFNEILLKKGLAVVQIVPPNVKYLDELIEAQEEAILNQQGVWSE